MNYDEMSFICQFNITASSITSLALFTFVQNMFESFNYSVKKIYYDKKGKVYSPRSNKVLNFDMSQFLDISEISFQSDYNKEDFEPIAKLYININYRYIITKKVIKISIVLSDKRMISDIMNTYKTIIALLFKNEDISLSGYSYFFPNYYCPISFSVGILRRIGISRPKKNIANWYSSSDISNSTIGLLNCFSNLSELQITKLRAIFGYQNISIVNRGIILINQALMEKDIDEYLLSDEYIETCKILEREIDFIRLPYYKEI